MSVFMCMQEYFDDKNLIILNLVSSCCLRILQCCWKISLESKVMPNIFKKLTFFIILLLKSMLKGLHRCLRQIWSSWHLSVASEAPEVAPHELISCSISRNLVLTIFMFFIFVKIIASSAYSEIWISLCRDRMLFISSNAIINKTTERGEPCGIPLCKMWVFDVTLFTRTLK